MRASRRGLRRATLQDAAVGRIFADADRADAGGLPRRAFHPFEQSQRAWLDERHAVSDRMDGGKRRRPGERRSGSMPSPVEPDSLQSRGLRVSGGAISGVPVASTRLINVRGKENSATDAA